MWYLDVVCGNMTHCSTIGLTREAWRYYRLLSLTDKAQELALRAKWSENDELGPS